MPRPNTVRIPSYARTALDDVVQRTQRPISLLIQDSIADMSRAFLADPNVIAQYSDPDPERSVGPMRRISIIYSSATTQILSGLSASSGVNTNTIARASWLRWLDIHGVDAIADTYGCVRPAGGGGEGRTA